MGVLVSQINSLTSVYSNVYSGTYQRKHQSSASLAFVRGIHRRSVNSPHKWPLTRKMFPFDDVIMSGDHFKNVLSYEIWGLLKINLCFTETERWTRCLFVVTGYTWGGQNNTSKQSVIIKYSTRLRFRSSDNIYIIQPRQDSIQIFQWRHMGVTASQIIRKSTVCSTVSLAQTKHQNSVLSATSMIIIIIMMVLCEGNPPLTGVLPSQRASTQIAKFMGTTRGCWPRSVSPYGVTRPQWVKPKSHKTSFTHNEWPNRFEHSTVVSLPCPVQNFKTIGLLKRLFGRTRFREILFED